MKRKTLKKGIMLLAISTLSVSMLSGCSLLKPTANSLLKSSGKKMQSAKDMGLDGTLEFGVELSKDGVSVGLDFDADLDMTYEKVKDGFESYIDAEVELSMADMSEKVKGEIYTVGDAEKVTTYSKSKDADEWVKEEESAKDNTSGMQNLVNVNFNSLVDKMTLEEETKEVHGRECYVLKGTVQDSDFADSLTELYMEDLGEVDASEIEAEVVVNIDKKDKMPVSMTIEIDDEIFEKAFDASEMEGLSVAVKSFEMEIVYKEINTGKTVDIPEEVFDASEKDDSDDDSFFGDISGGDDGKDEPEDDDDDNKDEPKEDDDDDKDEPKEDDDDDKDEPKEDDDDDKDEPEDDDDSNDGSESYGKGTLSSKEFKSEGFDYKEFVQKENEKIYLKIQNENKDAALVSVYVSFLKDGEVVDEEFEFLEFEPNTYQVADISVDTDYDTIEYTFDIDETTREYNGTEMDVYYVIEDDTITGTVTNEASTSASFAQVHVVLYDEDGNIIEHEFAYVEDEVVAPSEKSDYSMYIENTDYDSYEFYCVSSVE